MVIPDKNIRDGVTNVCSPSLENVFSRADIPVYAAEDIGGNLVPIREIVPGSFVLFPRRDIMSIVEPAEVISRLIDDVNVIRHTCESWIARFDCLESVDAEYLVFAVDHVATILRTVLYKILGETYT